MQNSKCVFGMYVDGRVEGVDKWREEYKSMTCGQR